MLQNTGGDVRSGGGQFSSLRQYLKTQKEMAKSAKRMFWVGLFESAVTLIGIILVGFTLFHTKRSADAATKMLKQSEGHGQRQLRAYVNIRKIRLTRKRDVIRAVINFKNSGQTPAYNLHAYWTVWGDTFPESSAEIPEALPFQRVCGSLEPGGTFNGRINVPINEEILTELKNGKAILRIRGKLNYIDAFDNPRNVEFSMTSIAFTDFIEGKSRKTFFDKEGNESD